MARDIDTHTHRVGRTGRAGNKGMAYTLITAKEKDFAGHLVRNLEGANQDVPKELLELAQQNPWFKKSRFKQQKAKRMNVGGKGLGFRERPGLGAASVSQILCQIISNEINVNMLNFNSNILQSATISDAIRSTLLIMYFPYFLKTE